MVDDEGGRQQGAWAHGLEQYGKVVRALLDGGELADGVDHHVVHARGEAGVGEGDDASVASTVWKRCTVRGRRPAPWMIWHSRLRLATIASIGASGFWSLGLGLEWPVLHRD